MAAEVVWKTSAPIGKIGRRVGFKVPRTFYRTFERRIGMCPSDFRAAAPAELEKAGPGTVPDGSDPEHGTRILAIYWRRQVMLGLLDGERARQLRRLLRQRYEVLRQDSRPKGYWRSSWYYDSSLLSGSNLELRTDAFRLTAAAIELDADRAPPELSELFDAIRKHLFEPKLKLEKIRQTAGLHESSIWRRFTDYTGQTPWSYVREARLETAAMLLLLTGLKILKISKLVGYTSLPMFRQSFHDFTGLDISEYRQRARWAREQGWMLCDDPEAAVYWERAVSGQLMVGDALELDEYLENVVWRDARMIPAARPESV